MTDTTISTANRVKQWDSKYFSEYVRANRFKRYMGSSENSIIQIKRDLTKKKGDAITIPLVGALDASSGYNTGSSDLVGSEKALPNDGHKISIGVVRDATVVNLEEEQASPIDIRNAGKTALKTLSMRYLRNDILTAFGSIDGVKYGSATASQLNTWRTNNVDRILYGDAVANYDASSATTHALSLNNITASMKLSKEIVSLLKRRAQNAVTDNGDGIRPFTYGDDQESFVLFAGTSAFRDLRTDMATELKDAEKRGQGNPLFSGPTSIYWDGVVVREIPEIAGFNNTASSPVACAPLYLCGAQSVGVAWAQLTKTTLRKEDDYGFKYGVGFFELRGIDKIRWGQGGSTAKDWGMVTGFVAAAAD